MESLRVLLIEDSEDDALLVTRALGRAGYEVTAERVDTAEALHQALQTSEWDLAIADYRMPVFSGTGALAIVRQHSGDLPFIFVSGTIGEDVAVAAMKDGAHDYIMKGNLARLAPAVRRQLSEAAVRRQVALANERLVYLAYHDALTDLPNRVLLHDRLQQALLAMHREGHAMSLLVLDLDGFKEVNDGFGHEAGDQVLQQVAARLRALLRATDTVARLGGDEFAILLPTTGGAGAELLARKVGNVLEQPYLVADRALVVSASIGIAAAPEHAGNGDELRQKADAAMYQAKKERSGYAVYSPDREVHTERRLTLTSALREAIATDQFALEYQPILHLETGLVAGVEALLRWNHPDQGRLQPKDFIRVAEHSGLITPLTMLAVELAWAEWRDVAGRVPFTIAVNLSPQSLRDPSFVARMRDTIETHGIDSSSLALEITESLIISDPERSIRCLGELRDMGIRIILDDFGTGYSSLSYLRRLPVDQLKIDQSFVMGMAGGEDEALVRSIIDLAHNLRLSVIAEGVETQAVCDQLRALGCDAAQGHLISRPGPAAVIAEWMKAHFAVSLRADS